MDHEGRCKCPCGYDANGELHVWDTYWAGLRVSQNDGPDDPAFCPNCDRELTAESVLPRDATEGQFCWNFVVVEGELTLAVAIDDALMEAFPNDRVRDLLMPTEGGHS